MSLTIDAFIYPVIGMAVAWGVVVGSAVAIELISRVFGVKP